VTVQVIRGDARKLPLADESVDLIVTSPPYFNLRSYTDGGGHYDGQIGAEATPAEYVASLVECTREWMRVLKPSGSMWINLGDKYAQSTERSRNGAGATGLDPGRGPKMYRGNGGRTRNGVPQKSLIGLPWRYAIACIDELGLILRAEVIWSKPNGLPESVTDRVRRSHETWLHFVRSPRYFSAVDTIREAHAPDASVRRDRYAGNSRGTATSVQVVRHDGGDNGVMGFATNPLGKLPGSVWEIATQPLTVPAELGVDHFAAFPMEWPRRIVQGWSPSGICTACGEGRRPVRVSEGESQRQALARLGGTERHDGAGRQGLDFKGAHTVGRIHSILGEVCACTPYTDHPGAGESSGPRYGAAVAAGAYSTTTGGLPRDTTHPGKAGLWDRAKVGPWREWHFDQWTPAPTRPAVVLDPFGGTGTTALVAHALGRHGISSDMSADYCRLAEWRTTDPGQLASALEVPKPPKQVEGQFGLDELLG
jgi:DNA modification methylase